ncbi:T9SS type A sorting domain-containing protein [Cryomorpha ignava]|uniref:T9SS type A sorting domain-containing protein n=1 Tax=Cryomorpha ignava TaxID=101383 RepID=A0A7K3WNF0_9FLAO|nr:T9SS type A sorting domain-containing protein [Cryomorpha ignava]NEN23179.1 T9SS type A sorting domain-containing protein [Cryomorpha ignava]
MNKLIRYLFLSVLLLMPLFSVAQTGPLGIGNGDGSASPTGYAQPRLLLWLDGSDVIRDGSNNVIQWTDQSGNDHHFTATGINRPTFQAAGGPSGTPCLLFDGADNRLVCSGFEFPSSGYSIYFVIKSNDSKYGIFSYATASEPHEVNIYNDNGFRQQAGAANDRASNIGNISTGIWNYGGIWWDNSSNILWEYNRSNSAGGENTSTFANGFNISPTGTAVIGDIQNSVNGGYLAGDAFNGQIAEIIIWEGTMTRPIGRMMRTYMHTKYGIDANGSNWDKFQGYASGSAGEYFTPIAIGKDNGGNPGEHNESRSNGLVLRINSGEFTASRTYLGAGQATSGTNTVIPSLASGVQQQWSRSWEIAGTDGSQIYQIGFDFGEGISGDIPQNANNYVLLRKIGIGGSYSEFTGVVSKAIVDDEVVFRVNRSDFASSNRYYTIGTQNAAQSSLTGADLRTWYAYQTGNWNNPTTWTLDGSAAPAYVNPGNAIPAIGDNVYIGSGRKVTISGSFPIYGALKVFGTLDVAAAPAPTFSSIDGNGLIRCSGNGGSGNFPIGNSTAFADAANGGTAEFYGNGGFTQNTDVLVNKLKINFGLSTDVITLSANLTHNGLFEINKGTLEVNNGSNSLTVNSNGRVLVESQGRIRTSTAGLAIKHTWNFLKDFIIDGDVRFTTRTSPNYIAPESTQFIEARFISGTLNQELRANGISYFSRIVVNKGIDMTYTLTINGAPNKFQLLGRCNAGMGANSFTSEGANGNSFALVNGTAEIKENIFIPLHHNGGNHNINETAMLWVNGGEVTKGFPSGTEAIVVYGTVKISAGNLNAYCKSGFTMRGNGLLQVDGGVVTTDQIRTSVLGVENIGGVIINGGQVFVDGNLPAGVNTAYYTFSLTYPGNLFRMTGGELHVSGPSGRGLIFINSDPENTSVSGGTVFLDVSDAVSTQKLSSRAAFWNLTITRSSASGTNRPVYVSGGNSGGGSEQADMVDQDLIVRNNLSITGANSPTLQMGTGSYKADLYLHGSFEIGNGAVYDHNLNTTRFVGNSNTFLTLDGQTKFFNNVEINKDTDTRYAKIQPTSVAVPMDVLGNFNVEKGYFDQGGEVAHVKGNIVNRSRIGADLSTGFILMNGLSGRQDIVSESGIFNKLYIDNPDGVELKNDGLRITNRFHFYDGSFFIGDNKLRIESTIVSPITGISAVNDQFVVCSGNASAGGVEIINHSGTQTIFYPFGVNSGGVLKYTPSVVYVNGGFIDEGYIRITPVDTLLSTLDISAGVDYLNYYWKISASEFDTRPNVTHRFQYDQSDAEGDETNFSSGRVLTQLPYLRSVDALTAPSTAHVNTGSNLIYYNGDDQNAGTTGSGTPLVNADYSAGDELRFSGSPQVFFSNSDFVNVGAVWDDSNNWNELSTFSSGDDIFDYHSSSHSTQGDFPEAGDIAIIGFDVDDPSTHKPHVYVAPSGGIEATVVAFTPLQNTGGNRLPRYFGSGSDNLGILRPTLKLGTTADIIKVQQITGEGALWLQSDIDLGVSDIGGFLNEDSSVVVIAAGSTVFNFLPANVPNLFVATGSPTISSDITVKNKLEIVGSSALLLSTNAAGNIDVAGDLILAQYQAASSNSRLFFRKGKNGKTVTVGGDVKILGNGSLIDISTIGSPPIVPVDWTPDEVGALLWLDASDASTIALSGTKVTGWDNKAGGTYNSYQTDDTKRPEYQSSGLNGENTIRFDGNNDFLRIDHNDQLNMMASQDFEIFSVIKSDVAPNQAAVYAKGGVSSRDFMLYFYNPAIKFYMDGGSMQMQAPTSVGSNANMGWARRQGNNGLLYNTISGTASDNGASGATNNGNVHNVSIGAMDEGTQRFFDGDIAEIILIKRALTQEEREQMEGYLAHKWGLEGDLPSGHPYKTEAPLIGGSQSNLPNQLIVEGDIIQTSISTVGMDLYLPTLTIPTDTTFVNLIVRGTGDHQYNRLAGAIPKIWKLEVDKGIDLTSSFTFNSDIDFFSPTNELQKPINLKNGLLKLNNAAINLTFSSGGGDFRIPETAGLELNAGNYQITGDETGLILEGLLKMTGGTFSIGDADGENNYIEYASSGLAKITIEGGSLIVGSQVRRGLTNTAGVLKYMQTGGGVVIGRYAAPAANRGMLEITNIGSSFEHTGGTLTFVRGVNSSSTPSLLIENPSVSNVSGTSEITIGNMDSPTGAQIKNFGIKSSIPLNKITIDNSSTEDPIVNLISLGLTLNDDLIIEGGASLNCGNQNLILFGDVDNDGLLSSTSSKVTLNHSSIGSVLGTGTFDLFNLERIGGTGGLTTVAKDLLVNNDFTLDAGTIDFGVNALTVKGDVVADGVMSFAPGSIGLIFNGNTEQQLDRSVNGGITSISTITIDNSLGVVMNNGSGYRFILDEKLRLSRGVLKLQGNLLELGLDAEIEEVNAFGEFNMISTGGAFTNFGVLKNVNANSTEDIFIPLGIDKYMPVRLDFAQSGFSSGTTPSSYLLKLNVPRHPVVIQDLESPDPEINDVNNVLGMYFSLDASNIGSNLKMAAQFIYDEDYMNVTSPYDETDYIAARVYSDVSNDYIFKFTGPDDVDEVNNFIQFNFDNVGEAAIDGDYFAGIETAIPIVITAYTTDHSGNAIDNTYTTMVPGGGAPSGARVNVVSNHVLTLSADNINFYRTDIADGATLKIDATSFHRLGRVTGTGTIHLVGTGNLPSGDYTNFFNCSGGKLIYEGRNGDNFEILANLPSVRKVDVIGHPLSLIKFSNNDATICEDLTIDGPEVDGADGALLTAQGNLNIETGSFNMGQGDLKIKGNLNLNGGGSGGSFSAGNQGTATIDGNLNLGGSVLNLGSVSRVTEVEGNITKTSGTITGGVGGARLKMAGTLPQFIDGDFTGSSKIPFLHVANSSGVTLYDNVEISDTLRLESGNLNTGIDSLVILTMDGTDIDPIGGSPSSFVNGPMKWDLLSVSGERIFPIGKNERYRPLRLSSRSANRIWEAEYYDTLATVQSPVTSMNPNPTNSPVIEEISIQEHWRVDHSTGNVSSKISLSWGENSAVATNSSDYSKLLVLSYNTSTNEWDSYGGDAFTYNAGISTGNFISQDAVSFSERFFTLGSSDGINPLPVTWLTFRGETNGDEHLLEWTTASEQNNDYFELERSIDAQNWLPVAKITGAGYSTTQLNYSFTDRDAPYGRVYYRIRQVDFDGKYDINPNLVSLERALKSNSEKLEFLVYPNPTKYQTVRMMLPGYEDTAVRIMISDLSGKVLSEQIIQIDGQGISQQIDCNYNAGIYLVTVMVGDKMRSKPLVISK